MCIRDRAYEQAVSGLSMAKLQYDSAKLNYDTQSENTVVTAPIAGVLEQFGVQVHDMSAGGSVAGVVSGAGGKTLTFNVSERCLLYTSSDFPFCIYSVAYSEIEFKSLFIFRRHRHSRYNLPFSCLLKHLLHRMPSQHRALDPRRHMGHIL